MIDADSEADTVAMLQPMEIEEEHIAPQRRRRSRIWRALFIAGISCAGLILLSATSVLIALYVSNPALSFSNEFGIYEPTDEDVGVTREPEIYVTFHGGVEGDGVNNIWRYHLNGSLIGPVISNPYGLRELRSMSPFRDGKLLVCNAYKGDSKILLLGRCEANGTRRIERVLVSPNEAMSHPYAAVQAANGNIYVTSQDEKVAISHFTDEGEGLVSPKKIGQKGGQLGVFHKLNPLGMTRGLATDGIRLFVCRKAKDRVNVYGVSNALVVAKIPISKPIGIYVSTEMNLILVGSDDPSKPKICLFNLVNLKLMRCVSTLPYTHPAGVTVHNNIVYFAAQDQRVLLSFPLNTLKPKLKNLAVFPDDPEGVYVSSC